MTFDDDELIFRSPERVSEEQSMNIERIKVEVINRINLPLEECKLNVLLKLTGTGSPRVRHGVDIVAVLDVSGSMRRFNRLRKVKTAMKFMIKKLSPMHRLSIVTFSSRATRLCPLRQMTESAQDEIIYQVDELMAGGGTNTEDGLRMALEILNHRRVCHGRVTAVLIMSDGDESMGSNAASLAVSQVPVYTFGVGADYTTDILYEIARNSDGGTFSAVDVEGAESSKMGAAFSLFLAGLLTVVVKDVQLTITPIEPATITKVYAGVYKQSIDSAGSITVSFPDLYDREVRQFLLSLDLPKAHDGEFFMSILEIAHAFRVPDGYDYETPPVVVNIARTNKKEDNERIEILLEQLRLETARMMRTATELAEQSSISGALQMFNEAKESLESAGLDQDNELIMMLTYELDELKKLTATDYERKGRPFSNSSESSHALQRAAARGDIEKLPLFFTDEMKIFLQQFTSYDNNPSQAVESYAKEMDTDIPFVTKLMKKESFVKEPQEEIAVVVKKNKKESHATGSKKKVAANPMAAMAAALGPHLGNAIRSLKTMHESLEAVQEILNNAAIGLPSSSSDDDE